jgi:hypothetical protein
MQVWGDVLAGHYYHSFLSKIGTNFGERERVSGRQGIHDDGASSHCMMMMHPVAFAPLFLFWREKEREREKGRKRRKGGREYHDYL